MIKRRRPTDTRPLRRDPSVGLSLKPDPDQPFRWLPRQGDPMCIGEWISQGLIKIVAYLPIYTAIVATLVLLVLLFGIPFVGGR